MSQWVNICSIDDILPATGVCALLGQQQVAIFRPYHDDRVFAISNIDPFFNASVLLLIVLCALLGLFFSLRKRGERR